MVITDLNGNMDSCQALVTVLDTNNPVANCRNISVYLNSSGTISIDSSDIDNGSTYSCGLASMSLSKSNFDCSNKGPNNITLTVTDIAGKSDSCQSIVTVIDAISPTPICRDTSIYINSLGSVTITSNFIDNGSYDNCGIDSVSINTS